MSVWLFPALALAALSIEAVAGYPDWLFRRVGHPVTWIGALIGALEHRWNRPGLGASAARARGIGAQALLITLALLAGWPLIWLAGRSWPGFLLAALATSSLFAQRSLDSHVAAVATALDRSLADGRRAVSMIVGRNPDVLDEAGVARAAIESLAENFSDGVVAPILWTALAGPCGGIAYKAANTADSMIGHKSERYLNYGWAAARLDDLINLPASRLAAALIVAAAAILPGCSGRHAAFTVWRDAGKHRSPNAGWPEAAMAGALGLSLNGPRVYGDGRVDDAFMGDGRRAATTQDIRRALRLYRLTLALQAGGLALAVLLLLAWQAGP